MNFKPRLFIASSVEGLEIAHAIQQNLEYTCQSIVWDQDVFQISNTSIKSLQIILNKVDFGVFVFTPDDLTKIRNETLRVARDNVILELGLFIGYLGIERCFIVQPRNFKDFHLPTDLLGLKTAQYDPLFIDNLQATLGPASTEIKKVIRNRGKFSIEEKRELNDNILNLFPSITSNNNLNGYWLSRFPFTAKRNKKSFLGVQYDIEHLFPVGKSFLFGSNILCSSSQEKIYWHDLKVQILGNYVLGNWYNSNTKNLGAFQLYIHTHNCIMSGLHLGNANDNSVQCGKWTWIKIESNSNDIELHLTELKRKKLKHYSALEEKFPNWIRGAISLKFEDIIE